MKSKFLDSSIRDLRGTIGLYFIYLMNTHIPYPYKPSRLIYIGMSESIQNSIGNRLRDHRQANQAIWVLQILLRRKALVSLFTPSASCKWSKSIMLPSWNTRF